MNLDIQFKLKSNPAYIQFLRDHSYWYKQLTRHPEQFQEFVDEVKAEYKMRPIDKINNVVDSMEMIKTFMGVLK